jgi:galactose oxidase-like protein/Kelch motif protein
MFQAPNGRVFYAGWSQTSRYLDPQGPGSWTVVGNSIYGDREAGTAVMYEPGKVLIVGGGGGRLSPGSLPTRTAETIDLTSGSQWQSTGSMAFARRHLNATLLPTGEVLVVGGTSGTGFNNAAGSVHAAEIWNPSTGTWKTVASNTINRIYHSTAILLPNGRVLVAGAGENFDPVTRTNDVNQFNAELYSPPYLFRGPRPSIGSAPATAAYGSTFQVSTPDAGSISKVSLVRPSSVTHSFDQNQRFMTLNFQAAATGLTVTAPGNRNLAPPGDYLLFILNSGGVPSMGRFVRIQ